MKIHRKPSAVTGVMLLAALPAFPSAVRNPVGSAGNSLGRCDDCYSAQTPLGFTAALFGSVSSTVFVNNNGNVTFGTGNATYSAGPLSGIPVPIIAPFFADVDTNLGSYSNSPLSGIVTYGRGTVTDTSLGWNRAAEFAVEWPAVGYYYQHSDLLNTFELLLVDRSDIQVGDFDIEFNYNSVQWDIGQVSTTYAAVGYSNGLSGAANVTYELPLSRTHQLLDVIGYSPNGRPYPPPSNTQGLVLNSHNSNVLGRYDFQIRNPAVAPEPASLLLLSGGLLCVGWFSKKA